MVDRLPQNTDGQTFKGQMLGTDEQGYVRKVKVDQDGELMVELSNTSVPYGDKDGRESFNGIFGEKYVAMKHPKFSLNFNYESDTRLFTETILNGGTVTTDINLLTLQTGTNVAGSAIFQSKSNLRYTAGRDAEEYFTAIFTIGKENSAQRKGLFDTSNGVFLGYEGVNFGASVRNNSSDIFVPQSSFNKDKLDGNGASGFTIDTTKLNIFRIVYGYLGIAPIYFSLFGGEEYGWITFHVHNQPNKQTSTHIGTPYLPIRSEVVNTGNNTNIKMQHGSMYAGVIDGAGAPDASSRQFSAKVDKAMTSGTNAVVVIFHNKTTINGIQNRIDDTLLKVGIGVEGTKPVTISLYKLSAVPTTTSFTNADLINSNMEYSLTGTINLTGAELMDSWAFGKSASDNIDVSFSNHLLYPDEYAVFTFTSTGASDINFINRWGELF